MPLALLFPPSLGPVTASARAELLSGWLSKRLGTWVTVEVADSYDELQQRIERGEVDLAWAPPAICAQVAEGARAIFKAVRAGSSMYQAALVVRAGEVVRLGDLKGKRAAWVDRRAAAGYLLAISCLRGAGVTAEDLAEQTFLGSYGRVVRAVLAREADVASVFVHEASADAVVVSLSEFVGVQEARRLSPLAFTDRAPSDGLVVVERGDTGGNEIAVEDVEQLVAASGAGTMLLSLLDAEALVRADPRDYDALRGG